MAFDADSASPNNKITLMSRSQALQVIDEMEDSENDLRPNQDTQEVSAGYTEEAIFTQKSLNEPGDTQMKIPTQADIFSNKCDYKLDLALKHQVQSEMRLNIQIITPEKNSERSESKQSRGSRIQVSIQDFPVGASLNFSLTGEDQKNRELESDPDILNVIQQAQKSRQEEDDIELNLGLVTPKQTDQRDLNQDSQYTGSCEDNSEFNHGFAYATEALGGKQ